MLEYKAAQRFHYHLDDDDELNIVFHPAEQIPVNRYYSVVLAEGLRFVSTCRANFEVRTTQFDYILTPEGQTNLRYIVNRNPLVYDFANIEEETYDPDQIGPPVTDQD